MLILAAYCCVYDWLCNSWSIGTVWWLFDAGVTLTTIGVSPNVTVCDLFCAFSIIGLLFWKFTFSILSPFRALLLPPPPPLLLFTVQLSFFTFSVITKTLDFLKLFFRRKLPDPFSLLRRDDVRCGRWRIELPRLRLYLAW